VSLRGKAFEIIYLEPLRAYQFRSESITLIVTLQATECRTGQGRSCSALAFQTDLTNNFYDRIRTEFLVEMQRFRKNTPSKRQLERHTISQTTIHAFKSRGKVKYELISVFRKYTLQYYFVLFTSLFFFVTGLQ